MERRKEFLLSQGSITLGDNLLSYQETVCATNVCVVKPNSFFAEIVRPLKPLLCPWRGYLLWLGIGIPNYRMHGQGGENGLQGTRIEQWRPEQSERVVCKSHLSSLNKRKKSCLEYSHSIYS